MAPHTTVGEAAGALTLPEQSRDVLFVFQANVVHQFRVEDDGVIQLDGPRRRVRFEIIDCNFNFQLSEIHAAEPFRWPVYNVPFLPALSANSYNHRWFSRAATGRRGLRSGICGAA